MLMVLWLILLLGGLVAGYALSARVESQQGNGLARDLAAREAARAGMEYAIQRMLDPNPRLRWAADGRANRFVFEGTPVEVEVRDETAKIDLNGAQPELLQAFFVALGEPRDRAAKLAAAIVDWRDADSLTQPGGGAEDGDYAAAGLACSGPRTTWRAPGRIAPCRPSISPCTSGRSPPWTARPSSKRRGCICLIARGGSRRRTPCRR